MKKQKMRAEIPCRTLPSKNQTEPYGASDDQKPFRGGPLNVAILWYVFAISRYFVLFRIILNKKGSPIGKLNMEPYLVHLIK